MKVYFNSILITNAILFLSLGIGGNLSSEEKKFIYLPFPDLPGEILEPEKILQDERSVSQPKEEKTNSNSEIVLKSPGVDRSNTTPSKVARLPAKKKDPSQKSSSKSQKYPSQQQKNLTQDSQNNKTSGENESLPTQVDLEKFQKSMAKIRTSESDDPKLAIENYSKLLEEYTDPDLRSQILIAQAWNYFHRNENLLCLDVLIRILEDESLIHSYHYPTAIYLAIRIHDRPWQGQNKNFVNRYKSIFQKNIDAEKPNFQNSHYRNLLDTI